MQMRVMWHHLDTAHSITDVQEASGLTSLSIYCQGVAHCCLNHEPAQEIITHIL
jgi:hypothetical protein